MRNKILSFGVLLFTWIMVMSPPSSAQSNMQGIKTNSTTVSTQSQQLPAAYYNASWTVVNERTDGMGEATISGVDPSSFIIPNTSTASTPEATQATVVYDNGPHINQSGNPDLSILESVTLNMNTLGGNISNSLGYGVADDFELVAETEITEITVYAYQTGAASTSINEMYVTIWDGDPSGGGSVVWGDQTTDVFDSVEDINAYRVAEDDLGGRARMLQKVKGSISGLTLAAGTYWLEYSLNGTESSGPWQPPIVILGESTTGDALQLTPSGYQAWVDTGTNTPQGLPFQIEGIEGGGGGHVYCIPEGTNSGRYIDNFSTTGGSENISNMGSGFSPDGYGDFYNTHTVAQAHDEDVEFEVDIEGGTAGFRVWVDWNQDGVFDTTEEVAYASSGYSSDHAGSFTVPADALEGDTRMRIVSHWLSSSGDIDPCETGFNYGEFEDYKFTVEGAGGGHVYCIPEGTNSGRYIDNFSTTGGTQDISNMGSGYSPDGYGDFYDTHTLAQEQGEDVTFEVDIEGGTAGFRAWVDWNQDGVFDTTEEVAYQSDGYSTDHTGTITVPADALEGDTRMRIVSHWLSTSGDVDPCETGFNYGEFEDYKFIVGEGSGGGGSDPCSQGTASNGIENGWGNVSLLIYANDFVVAEDETFTLEEMAVNFLLSPGFDIVSADIFFYEDTGGNGPGTEIPGTSSLGVVPDSQDIIGNHPGGFDQVEGVWTLDTPIAFEGAASGETVYWMGIEIEYGGASAFIETSSIYDTPNESYFSDDDGATWTSGLVNFGDDMHGVITFSGQCEGGSGGGGLAGETCVDPLVVTDLPYDDAGNTGDYGNFYSNGDVPPVAPDAVTTGTGSEYYLSGNEVVYAYTPADDEVLNISTTNDDDWIGLWAFTGCPFGSTVGYHTSIDGDTRLIEELPVTEGETYYFVISSWEPPESTDYTIHIERVGGGGDPGGDCSLETTGTFEDGKSFTKNLDRVVAHDITVPADQNMLLEKINLNAFIGNFGAGVEAQDVDIYIYEDNGGQPGAVLETRFDVVPTSQTEIGEAFGYQLWDVELDFAAVSLDGAEGSETTYWVGASLDAIDGSNTFWEFYSGNPVGYGQAYNDGTGFVMEPDNEGVYTFHATCSDIGGGGGSSDCITTIYDSGNNGSPGGAVYFDITVGGEDIELTSIDLNTDGVGTSFTVDVYTLEGTYVGNATNQGAWTMQTQGSGTSAGEGNPSSATLDDTFTLSANTTYGMALVMDGSHSHYYTNGDGANEHFENDDLELDLGAATNTPFDGTVFEPRVFNGGLCYNVGGGAGNDCLFDITNTVEPITRVVLADIDNTSSAVVDGSPALEDFTSIEGTMSQGVAYDVALEGNTDGPFTNYFTVWIDWDQNGEWEVDEMYEIGSINNSTGTDGQQATGTITVPADAPLGSTTMRVIKNFNASPTDPCGEYFYGQGEDYTIIVDDEVGMDDQSSTTFSYYPNPTSGVVNITANKDISSVSVVNILGQQIIAQSSLDNGQVDLSALATGTYMFRVMFEDGSLETFKVLKE